MEMSHLEARLLGQREITMTSIRNSARARVLGRPLVWRLSIRVQRVSECRPELGESARGPKDIAAIVRRIVPADEKEHFLVFLVDSRNRIKGYAEVSVGTLTTALVHPREIFRPAILYGAAAIIVAHNHPSGGCTPSQEDLKVTERLCCGGDLLGIPLEDHVIVGTDDFVSLRETKQL